jgi:hypothetical protein
MRLPNRLTSLAALLGMLAAGGPAVAQVVDRVFPLEPVSGAVVGKKPFLKIGLEGTDLPKVRFRIELSRDDFDTIDRTYDQMVEANGWAFTALGGESGALFMVRDPLEDGRYQWRVAAWNGVDWVPGKDEAWFVVDGVPPADVTGIEMVIDHDARSVKLRWDPVTVDQEGRPETVVKYHIYRYAKKTVFFVIRPFRLATVDTTWFDDTDRVALESPILFYKITAEDAAGNEPERRY